MFGDSSSRWASGKASLFFVAMRDGKGELRRKRGRRLSCSTDNCPLVNTEQLLC
jgi:hypothetical protein